MLSDMTDGATHLREIVQRHVEVEGLHPLARRTGLGIGQIRSICAGRAPLLSTVYRVCEALDLDLTIRPRGAAASADQNPAKTPDFRRVSDEVAAPGATADVAFEVVPDRHIAELLAAIADEYEALNGDGRASLLTRIWGLHPELRERERRLGRVLAWLGWRVVPGRADAAAAKP